MKLLTCNSDRLGHPYNVYQETAQGRRASLHICRVCPNMRRRTGYLTLAVSGAHVWADWLCHPCRLGGPCVGGLATSPLPQCQQHRPSLGDAAWLAGEADQVQGLQGQLAFGGATRTQIRPRAPLQNVNWEVHFALCAALHPQVQRNSSCKMRLPEQSWNEEFELPLSEGFAEDVLTVVVSCYSYVLPVSGAACVLLPQCPVRVV